MQYRSKYSIFDLMFVSRFLFLPLLLQHTAASSHMAGVLAITAAAETLPFPSSVERIAAGNKVCKCFSFCLCICDFLW